MHSGVLVCAVVEDQLFHWWLRTSAYSTRLYVSVCVCVCVYVVVVVMPSPGGVGVRVVLFRSLLKALTETPRYATVF